MKDDRRKFGHYLQRFLVRLSFLFLFFLRASSQACLRLCSILFFGSRPQAHDESLKLESQLRSKVSEATQMSHDHFRVLREALVPPPDPWHGPLLRPTTTCNYTHALFCCLHLTAAGRSGPPADGAKDPKELLRARVLSNLDKRKLAKGDF